MLPSALAFLSYPLILAHKVMPAPTDRPDSPRASAVSREQHSSASKSIPKAPEELLTLLLVFIRKRKSRFNGLPEASERFQRAGGCLVWPAQSLGGLQSVDGGVKCQVLPSQACGWGYVISQSQCQDPTVQYITIPASGESLDSTALHTALLHCSYHPV